MRGTPDCVICGKSGLIPGIDGYKCSGCGWCHCCIRCRQPSTSSLVNRLCLGCDIESKADARERKAATERVRKLVDEINKRGAV